MKVKFEASKGLIIVPTRLYGINSDTIVRLALDTGATSSMINWDIAVLLGYDPASLNERVQITTGSGVEFAPKISLNKIEVMGKSIHNFHILCHTLPSSAMVDGLLGLDFFRGECLILDFRAGIINLSNG